MSEWKEWTNANILSENENSEIEVLFADGIYGVKNTLKNWAKVQYAETNITHYRIAT